jgi:glycosyltransferase involved in cell wall biosynthesis
MKTKTGVSIIVPTYNEEENLPLALISVKRALKGVSDWEIIIVDDGSTDMTLIEAKRYARENKRIRVIALGTNLGFGMGIRRGIKEARKPYIGGFPGDNDMSWKSLKALIRQRTKVDLVISYMDNPGKRSFKRQWISKVFILLMNTIFGHNLRYYNGYLLGKSELLQSLPLVSEGFSIFAEIIIRLLCRNIQYKEIPFIHIPRRYGKSTAVGMKSVLQTLSMVVRLKYDLLSR